MPIMSCHFGQLGFPRGVKYHAPRHQLSLEIWCAFVQVASRGVKRRAAVVHADSLSPTHQDAGSRVCQARRRLRGSLDKNDSSHEGPDIARTLASQTEAVEVQAMIRVARDSWAKVVRGVSCVVDIVGASIENYSASTDSLGIDLSHHTAFCGFRMQPLVCDAEPLNYSLLTWAQMKNCTVPGTPSSTK